MKVVATSRVFLLSPAYAGGQRARMVLSDRAQFDLARKLRGAEGAPLGEVFTFLSGLYFRGKLAYANAFARPSRQHSGVLVITPTRGLVDATTRIGLEDLKEFAAVDIDTRTRATAGRWCAMLENWRGIFRKSRSCSSAASQPANMLTSCWRTSGNVYCFQETS